MLIERLVSRIDDYVDRHSPILILTPYLRNFGDCAEDMYYGLLQARREKKRVLFLFQAQFLWKSRLGIANGELLRLESDYRYLGPDNIFCRLAGVALACIYATIATIYLLYRKLIRGARHVWPHIALPRFSVWYLMPSLGRSTLRKPAGVRTFSWNHVPLDRWQREREDPLPIRLSADKFLSAHRTRLQIGIPLSDWFVCLHVREGDIHGIHSTEVLRDARVETYIEAIRDITHAGGWVVRVGKPPMTPLPRLERVVDYPLTAWKSDLMDLYFLDQCRFLVGSDSGPWAVASFLFRKAVLVTNLIQWLMPYPLRHGDMVIPKHCFSKSRNRFLSLKERVEDPPCYLRQFVPNKDDYVMHDNTSQEIREAVREMLRHSADDAPSRLQSDFNQKRAVQVRRFLDAVDRQKVPSLGIDDCYHASVYISGKSVIAQSYLEQNWDRDSMTAEIAVGRAG